MTGSVEAPPGARPASQRKDFRAADLDAFGDGGRGDPEGKAKVSRVRARPVRPDPGGRNCSESIGAVHRLMAERGRLDPGHCGTVRRSAMTSPRRQGRAGSFVLASAMGLAHHWTLHRSLGSPERRTSASRPRERWRPCGGSGHQPQSSSPWGPRLIEPLSSAGSPRTMDVGGRYRGCGPRPSASRTGGLSCDAEFGRGRKVLKPATILRNRR